MNILHVIREVTTGGGTLGVYQQCAQTKEIASHRVLSLRNPSNPSAVEPFVQLGIPVFSLRNPKNLIKWADIVQLEWWNNPEINNFLLNEDLPLCRLLLHSRAHFDAPAMCPSINLLRRVNCCTVTIPSAAKNHIFNRNRIKAGLPPAECIYSSVLDFKPENKLKKLNKECVFGYLGTVEPIKIHPKFLHIIRNILDEVPEARFLFAGEGTLETYKQNAESLGLNHRIEFLDFVADTTNFLRQIDVFFYPISKYTYATSEKALQEAMLSELPCVLFAHGGIRDIANPDFSFIANDEASFVSGCIQLAKSPLLRMQMGKQARRAIENFPPRQNWQSILLKTWKNLYKIPKESRQSLNVRPTSLFEYSTDMQSLCSKDLIGAELDDCRIVADFVNESYRQWIKENSAIG